MNTAAALLDEETRRERLSAPLAITAAHARKLREGPNGARIRARNAGKSRLNEADPQSVAPEAFVSRVCARPFVRAVKPRKYVESK